MAKDHPGLRNTVQIVSTSIGNPGFCSGALIENNWVITATHCIRNTLSLRLKSPLDFAINFPDYGTTIAKKRNKYLRVKEPLNVFKSWTKKDRSLNGGIDPQPNYEVALVNLDGTSPLNYVKLPILRNLETIKDDTILKASGFGRLFFDQPNSEKLWQGLDVKKVEYRNNIHDLGLAPDEPCLPTRKLPCYKAIIVVQKRDAEPLEKDAISGEFTSSDGGTCSGDSGGPLYAFVDGDNDGSLEWYLVGVLWGSEIPVTITESLTKEQRERELCEGGFSLYSFIGDSEYYDWIQTITSPPLNR